MSVSVSLTLEMLGGVATRAQLVQLTSLPEVRAAIAAEQVVSVAFGRYVSPTTGTARREAHRVTGTLCLKSAALAWGWAVRSVPTRPQVTVARNRKLKPEQRRAVEIRRADLGPDDVREGVTSQDRTLLDCGRALEFNEALAVFDSALGAGYSPSRLRALTRDARGPGARQLQRLAAEASPKAANPFESGLRAIALDVAGLSVRPQVPIYGSEFLGRPDLVDDQLGIALEADSFEWHGGRTALGQDARRYNRLVVNGWLVLRFAWEDVMFDPLYVREMLEAAVSERTYRADSRLRPA